MSAVSSRQSSAEAQVYATTRLLLPALLALAVTACAIPERAPAPAAPPVGAPAPPAATRYELDSSEVRVLVFRDGPLKQLGHNHVIVSRALTGHVDVREPLGTSSFELALPLESLSVDEPALRAEEGAEFPGEIADQDREGTRRNMLSAALLDAAAFPVLRMASAGLREDARGWIASTRVMIRGAERSIEVPVSVTLEDGRLVAHGEFTVTHEQLGLTPFSAAMGALRVRDDIVIRCRFTARRS
jgi:hypothetical protein